MFVDLGLEMYLPPTVATNLQIIFERRLMMTMKLHLVLLTQHDRTINLPNESGTVFSDPPNNAVITGKTTIELW